MVKDLVAKCGKTGFKNPQGLQGHERMCAKCRELSGEKTSTQKPENKGCEHEWRLLTDREKLMRHKSNGKFLGESYEAVCIKPGCRALK